MNILQPDDIDFAAYLHETDAQQKVKSAAVWIQDLIDNLGRKDSSPKAYLPWQKTYNLFQFRPGEVTLWAGVNGHGKSLITGMTALALAAQKEPVCMASFEMKPIKTLERMARQWSGQNPGSAWADDPVVVNTFKDLYGQFKDWSNDRIWLYDQQGTVKAETVISMARYCAKELGIKHVFIDSLMKCVRGEDDFNGQKDFVDELCSLARDNQIHIHLVHHIRKLSSESETPDKTDVKGSGSITDQVDNVLMMWRNKRKENDAMAGKKVSEGEPDAMLICGKQRNGEWEGKVMLWFDRDSQQFVGAQGGAPIDLYNLERA